MVELAVLRTHRVEPVLAVSGGSEVRAPIAVDVLPEEAVLGEVAGSQVLERDAVSVEA